MMKLEKIIVVLGPPGSGKGTQSKLLKEKLGYGFFSMGEALRSYAMKDNELGRAIKQSIDQGLIVADHLAEQVVMETWKSYLDLPGLISEGYPRTLGQVAVLDRFLATYKITPPKVLSIQVDKQKLIDRILKRSQDEGRVDDAHMVSIEKRFEEYHNKTAKIIEYYKDQGLVIEINGDQPIEAVHQEILEKLGFK